jgi:hypothetical protein
MNYCMDESSLGPYLLIIDILWEKCSSVNCSGGDWLMLCQLMEIIVLVVCKCWWCLLLIHFCGQDGGFFGTGCCMNYEILKETEALNVKFLTLGAVQIMKCYTEDCVQNVRYHSINFFASNKQGCSFGLSSQCHSLLQHSHIPKFPNIHVPHSLSLLQDNSCHKTGCKLHSLYKHHITFTMCCQLFF